MAKKTNSNISKARAAYKQAVKTSKPGEGKRFAAMENLLEAEGVNNPGAVAAAVGRKKWGKERMAKWAATGKKRKKR